MDIDLDSGACRQVSIPVISLPASKSIAARALILSEIYSPTVLPVGLPDCSDTVELYRALRRLRESDGKEERYDLGSGATSLRFFLAYVASLPGFSGVVDCSAQLRERPLRPLIDVLRRAGAEIRCLGEEGNAPVHVVGRKLKGLDADVDVDAGVSSQFVSALMMASLLWEKPFEPSMGAKSCGDRPVSAPYVEMTSAMMREFAMIAENFRDAPTPMLYEIELDW